jgi:hypothetical protein
VRYSTVNSASAILQIANVPNSNTAFSSGSNNLSFHDIVGDNLLYPTGYKFTTGIPTIQLWEDYRIPSAPQTTTHVTVNHVTGTYNGAASTVVAMVGLSGPMISTGFNMANIAFTNNLGISGTTGTLNETGSGITGNCAYGLTATPMINACWSPYTVGGNCFLANGSVAWPGTNVTSVASPAVAFTKWNNGNAGNYLVASGACKGAATDGSDPGANLTTLALVIAGNPPPQAAFQGIIFNGGQVVISGAVTQ